MRSHDVSIPEGVAVAFPEGNGTIGLITRALEAIPEVATIQRPEVELSDDNGRIDVGVGGKHLLHEMIGRRFVPVDGNNNSLGTDQLFPG